jgi:hypothetical protein
LKEEDFEKVGLVGDWLGEGGAIICRISLVVGVEMKSAGPVRNTGEARRDLKAKMREEEARRYNRDDPHLGWFYRPHTISILILSGLVLVYVAFSAEDLFPHANPTLVYVLPFSSLENLLIGGLGLWGRCRWCSRCSLWYRCVMDSSVDLILCSGAS